MNINQKITKIIDIVLEQKEISENPNYLVINYGIFLKELNIDNTTLGKIFIKLEKDNYINSLAMDESLIPSMEERWGGLIYENKIAFKPNYSLLEKGYGNKYSKTKIFISREFGIYVNEKTKKPTYGITGKRQSLVYCLKDGKKDGNILIELFTENNFSLLSGTIKTINEIFKKKLNLGEGLIINLPTGGYKLNDEKFKLEFVD